jgi:hypothetical protein
MPAVDIAPLMDSPLWKSWEQTPEKRRQALDLWQDKDTSEADRASMLQMMQGARTAAPVETPAPVPPASGPAVAPATPSPWQALKGAFTGEQRLPFQAGAPAEGTDPAELQVAAEKQYIPAPVRGVIEGLASPSNVLEGVATLAVPGPLKPIAAGVAAGAGEGLRQWGEGEPMDWRKMANEALWSAAPEAAESVGRHTVRQFAKNTPGGIRIRSDQAATEARGIPERIFHPKPAEKISEAFEDVRRSGLNIDTQDLANHLTTLSTGKKADTLNILMGLDREHRTGGRYVQLYHDLTTGRGSALAGSSIGDLQNMRSVLRQHGEKLQSPEARQLVSDLKSAVDDTIDYGLTSGANAAASPQIRDTLHTARRDWAQRMAADDMGELIEGKISSSPNLQDSIFSLRGLYDELRRGRSQASKSVNRSLDLTPGAREGFEKELDEISRLYQNVEMSLSDVSGISRMPLVAGVRQGLGQVLLTDWGRKWFKDAIIEGRGTLSPNAVGFLVNVARREFAPGAAEDRPIRPAQESRRAPGGTARSTD